MEAERDCGDTEVNFSRLFSLIEADLATSDSRSDDTKPGVGGSVDKVTAHAAQVGGRRVVRRPHRNYLI